MKKYLAVPVLILWLVLAGFAWFQPGRDVSEAERRPLKQMPGLTMESVLDGSFMEDFGAYALDQFPLRDGLRTVKSLFHYYVLGQKDNNGIYLSDGYAAKQEYPLKEESIAHAVERFAYLREKYLTDSKIYMAVVPDKGYYLAEDAGQLALDYERLYDLLEEGMPWAQQIDLREALSIDCYYRTDTHWRQEKLLSAAKVLCEAMGVAAPEQQKWEMVALDRPFYGVYYGQAALPMPAETMYVMESGLLSPCTVYDYESGKTGQVYDRTKLDSRDLYDVFLSGSRSLLTIENPNAATDKELLIFRDSFGSSMAPLLVQDYAKVTLIDIRYIQIDVLERFVEFQGQDVLLLYSTLVLNNSETIK